LRKITGLDVLFYKIRRLIFGKNWCLACMYFQGAKRNTVIPTGKITLERLHVDFELPLTVSQGLGADEIAKIAANRFAENLIKYMVPVDLPEEREEPTLFIMESKKRFRFKIYVGRLRNEI